MNSPGHRALRILGASAVAAAAAVMTACSSGGGSAPAVTLTPPPSATGAAGPGGPSPATSSPATSAPATSPAPVAGGQCATASLRVHAGHPSGTAGTIYYDIDFTNVSGSTCVLEGYPGVSLVSAGSNSGSQIGADAKRTSSSVRAVTVTTGQTAHAVLGVAEAGNFPAATCNPVTAHWLKVFPPGMRAAVYAPFTTQTCASTSQPTMTITAISPGA